MIRRLVMATALAAMLCTAGASLATATPASRGTCVVVRPADLTACVTNPFDAVPDAPGVPDLPAAPRVPDLP